MIGHKDGNSILDLFQDSISANFHKTERNVLTVSSLSQEYAKEQWAYTLMNIYEEIPHSLFFLPSASWAAWYVQMDGDKQRKCRISSQMFKKRWTYHCFRGYHESVHDPYPALPFSIH
jgi:hypothetical protein